MFSNAERRIPEPQANTTSPESGEHFIDFDVREERAAMRAKAEQLKVAVGTPAEFARVAKSVEPSRLAAFGRSLARRSLKAVVYASVYVASSQASEAAEDRFPIEYDSFQNAVEVPIDAVARLLPVDRLPEEQGQNNFSMDKIEEQRAWLKGWLEGRRLGEEETPEMRQRMMAALESTRVSHVYHEEGRIGQHMLRGPHRGVELNSRDDENPMMSLTPLHEFSHGADKHGRFIAAEEKALIPELISKKDKTGENYFKYVTGPTEFKARLMAVRRLFDLKPDQLVDDEVIKTIYDEYAHGIDNKNLNDLMDVIKDAESLKRALNEMTANEVAGGDNEDRMA